MTDKKIILDEFGHVLKPHSAEEIALLNAENADLWATFYGFKDAAGMEAEGARMERERLTEISKKGEQP